MKYLLIIPIFMLMISSVLAIQIDDFNLKAKGDSNYGYLRIISELSVKHDAGKPMIIEYHGGNLNGNTIRKGVFPSGKGILKIEVFNNYGDNVNINLNLKEKSVISDDGNLIIINNRAEGTVKYLKNNMETITIENLRYEYNRNDKTIRVISQNPYFVLENLKVK